MSRKLDEMGVSAFCESVGMLLGSGVRMDEAVGLLRREHGGGALDEALKTMEELLEGGSSLADAMEKTGAFPAYALKMTRAGERAGRLEDVLLRLGRYYADQKTIGEKLKNAVTYPAAMLALIIVVLAALLAMVLPAFTDVYDSLTGSLASSAYGYIRWAYGVCIFALAVMGVLAVGLIVGMILWKKNKSLVEGLLLRVPISRAILESMGLFRFTSALATFLSSGESQDMAVLDSLEMVDCTSVENKIKQCIRQMEEGHSFATASSDAELLEPVYARMLLAGERSGGLEQALERLTGLLEEECGAKVDRLVAVVDPLLSGVLMLTVGMSLLSVMLPLVGMMNAIG